jgi:hypothetical protein
MSKKFQKNIEDFTCEHCKFSVPGIGYTNHCPHCLWSKHVDVNPGDRQSDCNGMMKPTEIQLDHGQYILIHKCEKCGLEKANKTVKDDSFEEILKLSAT